MNINQVDLFNTPGIYYGTAYWISSMVFLSVRGDRRTGLPVLMKQLLVLAALDTFMLLGYNRVPQILFPFTVAAELALIFLNLHLGSEMGRKELFYTSVRAFIVGELASALHWQLFYFALTSLHMPLRFLVNCLFQIPAWLFVFEIGRASCRERV